MESECRARLEALRRDGADHIECACWAIKQLSAVPQPQPVVPDGGHPAGASAEVRILRAQVAHALSNAGTTAALEVLVTAALQSVAQAPAPALQPQEAAPACSAAPLFHTITQQLLGHTSEPGAAMPLYALAHLGTLWPREVAGALVEAVACAGARLPDAAGALPARPRSPQGPAVAACSSAPDLGGPRRRCSARAAAAAAPALGAVAAAHPGEAAALTEALVDARLARAGRAGGLAGDPTLCALLALAQRSEDFAQARPRRACCRSATVGSSVAALTYSLMPFPRFGPTAVLFPRIDSVDM